jgi:hypothetical protein
MDGNPRMAFWDKFNPNNNYEVIDEEKYASLFKLRMNLQDIDIFEEDTLVFNLPENSSIAYNAEEKTKTINLKQSENYVVTEITPSAPFEGLLWYHPTSKILRLYKNGSFRKMLTEDEVNSLISDLNDTISSLNSTISSLDARVTALETP